MKSRRDKFVDLALRYAADDSHGYSQKPPSGRWGPDYDCSSLIYRLANEAGYPVGTGSDKVRFTGTMLKDFEKAGFQILPFANVGISDLEIGDILLNLALHAEVYVGNGESVGATSSETGKFVGEAGDQTGREIERHPVTTFDKEWDYVLRPKDDDESTEEGDKEMPMNYNPPYTQPVQGPNGMYSPTTFPQSYQQGYMQGYRQGYPQGGLSQANGYSQSGMQGYGQGYGQGYPQGAGTDLHFVMGIEGAKNYRGMPNSREALFDEDKPIMYVVSYDQQGNVNDIHVYQFEECSEEMPQHLSPLMQQSRMQGGMSQQADYVTREEFDQLKEMLTNAKPAPQSDPNAGPRPNQSATAGRAR